MMTKEEFYHYINRGRYPKYLPEQIKEGIPENNCSAIVLTSSNKVLLAKYEHGKWQQAHFTSAADNGIYPSQEIYYSDIEDDIIYWTDGQAKDRSRGQNDD